MFRADAPRRSRSRRRSEGTSCSSPRTSSRGAAGGAARPCPPSPPGAPSTRFKLLARRPVTVMTHPRLHLLVFGTSPVRGESALVASPAPSSVPLGGSRSSRRSSGGTRTSSCGRRSGRERVRGRGRAARQREVPRGGCGVLTAAAGGRGHSALGSGARCAGSQQAVAVRCCALLPLSPTRRSDGLTATRQQRLCFSLFAIVFLSGPYQ